MTALLLSVTSLCRGIYDLIMGEAIKGVTVELARQATICSVRGMVLIVVAIAAFWAAVCLWEVD